MRAGGLKIAIAMLAASIAAAGIGLTASAFSTTTGNSGNSFATAASFDTCPGTTVTSGFVHGFETGRRGYAVGTVMLGAGNMTFDGTAGAARTGAYSMKVQAAGAASYGQHGWGSPIPTTQVTRFALRLDAQPTADVNQLMSAGTATGNQIQLRYLQATNRFAMAIRKDGTSPYTVVSGSVPVQIGTWHVIESRYSVGGTTHTVDWQVDETAQTSASVAGTATVVAQTQLGTSLAESLQAHYDDLLISRNGTQYPLGDGKVYPIRPNGMGTSVNPNNFQDDDGTAIDAASWQRLDEVPMDSTTDYIQQTTAAAGSYAEMTLENTTQTCIRAAHATFSTHGPSSNQSNYQKLSVFDGATESIIREGSMSANTTQSRNYAGPMTPATSPWSQSALNGLVARWGYGSTGQDVSPLQQLDGVMIEYEVPQ